MSVFTLAQLAVVAGKDARTMRRWCERGFFGRAARRARAGGHWRVTGADAAGLVAGARKNARGFERKRKTEAEKAAIAAQRVLRRVERVNRLMTAKIAPSRAARAGGGYILRAVDALLGKSGDELALLGLDEETLRKLPELPLHGPFVSATMRGALCVWIAQGNGTRAGAARCAGLSRRSFGRSFGRYWRSATKLHAVMAERSPEVLSAWISEGRDKRTGATVSTRGGVAWPESASDGERRRWAGSMQGSSKRAAPNLWQPPSQKRRRRA